MCARLVESCVQQINTNKLLISKFFFELCNFLSKFYSMDLNLKKIKNYDRSNFFVFTIKCHFLVMII